MWVVWLYATVPATAVAPGPLTVKVVALIVEALIASLNEAVMTATPTAPLAGLVERTVGATVSVFGPVGSDEQPAISSSAASRGQSAWRAAFLDVGTFDHEDSRWARFMRTPSGQA